MRNQDQYLDADRAVAHSMSVRSVARWAGPPPAVTVRRAAERLQAAALWCERGSQDEAWVLDELRQLQLQESV